MARIKYDTSQTFGALRGYVHSVPQRKQILIERHPLWQDDHPVWMAARAAAQSQYPTYRIFPFNPFAALRRPGDYV
jgi:hypothetical protein